MAEHYDALLVISFGGPERPEDVRPFLENVCRGKNVPPERLAEAAGRYEALGGASPLGAGLRAMLVALADELRRHKIDLPVYLGNRNWHPLLADTLRQMAADGVRRALGFVTSAFGSYPGCRQYREDVERARAEVGPDAPVVDKLRLFYNHPGFIGPMAERAAEALVQLPETKRPEARLVFTAHSLPVAMAEASPYVAQLRESCRLVAEQLDRRAWELVFQSRSGRPDEPWLEPDVGDYLVERHQRRRPHPVVLIPIGFLLEHAETAYDLDVEVAALCDYLGISMVRAATVGCHPRVVAMIRELVEERLVEGAPRLALGPEGPSPDLCPPDCCRWSGAGGGD